MTQQLQAPKVSTAKRVLDGATDFIYGFYEIPRTLFGVDTLIMPRRDARNIRDERMDSYDKKLFAFEARYYWGVNPVKTYSEFVGGYGGEKPLVVYLLERLKAERTPRRHPLFAFNLSEEQNIGKAYQKRKSEFLKALSNTSRK